MMSSQFRLQLQPPLPPQLQHTRVTRACHYCHVSKAGCDGNRPCHRCIRLEKVCRNRDPTTKELRFAQYATTTVAAAAAAAAAATAANDSQNVYAGGRRQYLSTESSIPSDCVPVPGLPTIRNATVAAAAVQSNGPLGFPFKEHVSSEFDSTSHSSLDPHPFLPATPSTQQALTSSSFVGDPWFLSSNFLHTGTAQRDSNQLHMSFSNLLDDSIANSIRPESGLLDASSSAPAPFTPAAVSSTPHFDASNSPNMADRNDLNQRFDSQLAGPTSSFVAASQAPIPVQIPATREAATKESNSAAPVQQSQRSSSPNSYMPSLGRAMVENHTMLNSMKLFRSQLERREIAARRIQFYFCQLSEILDAASFAELVAQLPIHVPLSTKVSYSITEAAMAHSKAKAAVLSFDSNSSSSNPTQPASTLSYVEFSWHSSPSVALSDPVSCGIAGPLALLRMERKGPFLEDAHQFRERKKRFVKKLPVFKNRSKSRKRKKSSSKSSDAGHRRRRKHRKKHGTASSTFNIGHAHAADSSNQLHGDRNVHSDDSTHYSSDSSYDSDSTGVDDDSKTDDSLISPTIGPVASKYHLPACPFAMNAELSLSSSTSSSEPASTVSPARASPCQCPPLQHVPMSVQVNGDWERLFGMTQTELRNLMKKDGAKALHRFTRLDRAGLNHRTKVEAILGVITDYNYFSVILNKWGGEVPCLVHAHISYDEGGTLLESVHSWTPLPTDLR